MGSYLFQSSTWPAPFFPRNLPSSMYFQDFSAVLSHTDLLYTTARIHLCNSSYTAFSPSPPQGGCRSRASFPECLGFPQLVFLAGLPLLQLRAPHLETTAAAEQTVLSGCTQTDTGEQEHFPSLVLQRHTKLRPTQKIGKHTSFHFNFGS